MGPLARLQDTTGALHSLPALQGSTAGLSSSAGQQETPVTPPTTWVVQLLWEWGGCLPSLPPPKRHVSPINPEREGLSPHSGGDTEHRWLGLEVSVPGGAEKPFLPSLPHTLAFLRLAALDTFRDSVESVTETGTGWQNQYFWGVSCSFSARG